jgi:subtilase family serine protease
MDETRSRNSSRQGHHAIRLAGRAALPVWLFVMTTAAGPLGTPPSGSRDSGPRIAEPQGRFDATYVGPVEPISKVTLAGMHVNQAQADLVVRGLGFTAEGKVRYFVQNVGGVATSGPFVVDIHYNGQRRDTVKHNGLPGLSQQRVESSLANPGGCAQAQLHAIADSQQAVAEASESNNSASIVQVPPCPDLVVQVLKEDVSALSYRARVKVTNQGTRATGRHFIVLIRETNVPAGVIATPPADKRIENLAAGQSTSFVYGGSHLKTTTVSYHAVVDRFDDVKESNEGNNNISKALP